MKKKKYLRLVKDGASGTDVFSYFHSAVGTSFINNAFPIGQ